MFEIVESAVALSPDGATATTIPIDTTGAKLFFASVGMFSNTGTLTDSKGNIWIPGIRYENQGSVQSFFCLNPIVGTGHTFNITFPISSLVVIAFKAGGIALVGENGFGVGIITSLQPGSRTPGGANRLFITSLSLRGEPNAVAQFPVVNQGFTIIEHGSWVAGKNLGIDVAVLIQTNPVTVNPTWSWPMTDSAKCSLFEFSTTDVPPPSGPPLPSLSAGLGATIILPLDRIVTLGGARRNQITWEVIGTGVVNLLGSLNQIDFAQIDTITGPDMKTFLTGVSSVKAVLASGGPVTVRLRTVGRGL